MSRALAILAALAAALLLGCPASDPAWEASDPFQAFGINALTVGASCYSEASASQDPNPPADTPQSLEAPGGACAPHHDDDPCVACLRPASACCMPAVACGSEMVCTNLIACRSGGRSASSCEAELGPADAAYDAALACVTDHCSAECPRLR